MRVLFDTNILLDVLLNREPFVHASSRLLARVERRQIEGMISATSITTIDYLVSKAVGRKGAAEGVRTLLSLCTIAPVDRDVLELALVAGFRDFEDAVLHEAGRIAGADVLVTRNADDFKAGSLLVHSPVELESALQVGGYS